MRFIFFLLTVSLSLLAGALGGPAPASAAGGTIYLPVVTRNYDPVAGQQIINAPYLSDLVVNQPCPETTAPPWCLARFSEMAVAWFGRITNNENYVDIRAAYSDSELVLYLAVIDRYVWYDTTPAAADLLNWDSVSVLLDVANSASAAPATTAYRFDVQYSGGGQAGYRTAYRGNGSGWGSTALAFSTFTSDRWESGPPNGGTSKGWAAQVRIPFASLGLARPADGAIWRLAVVNRDRDASGSATILAKTWPETVDSASPASWSRLRFGLPVYSSSGTVAGTTTIRHGLEGATVPDANVGGYSVCGGGKEFWTQWGNATWSSYNPDLSDFNVQNQADISDWPCFAKYYVTFPLTAIPAGKIIRSATLTLHQFGNSEPSEAKPSLLQAFIVPQDANAATFTWNNAPLALENIGRAWVDPLPGFAGFPGVARTMDVSYGVARAYAQGQPLRLALYSADSHYHSGKYFISSASYYDTGRPTLTVKWVNP